MIYPRSINWGTVKARLMKASFTENRANEFLSDVASHNATGTNVTDLTLTFTRTIGPATVTMDAADLQWTNVTSTDIAWVILYDDTGSASTSRLLATFDIRDNGSARSVSNATIQLMFDTRGIARFDI